MDPSAAFNQFYGNFMAELGLAFPDNDSVAVVRDRAAEAMERDPAGPSRALPAQIDPIMEYLMAHDRQRSTGEETDELLQSVADRVDLLRGLSLPASVEGEDGAVRENKAAVIDYVRNLGLMSIGLAHMPPGVLDTISALVDKDADGGPDGGAKEVGDVLGMLAPMLGPLLGSMPGFAGI